jgi:sugar lactone lactonase YvrE
MNACLQSRSGFDAEREEDAKVKTPKVTTLMTGLAYGESPRWHEGRLWFCNWTAREIVVADARGRRDEVVRVPFDAFPFSIDWLPDGRLLMSSMSETPLLRQERDGVWVPHAEMSALSPAGWNEIVVDGRGNAYVNGSGFDARDSDPFAPGIIAMGAAPGSVRQVADDIHFPNGMAVTADNSTLVVAESFARRLSAFDIAPDGSLSNRRVWADLGSGAPDGICFDAEGAIWYADVPNKRCVRVREGGEVLQSVDVDRGCFACMLGGDDGRTLFITAAQWRGFEHMTDGSRSGVVLATRAPAPRAGWP